MLKAKHFMFKNMYTSWVYIMTEYRPMGTYIKDVTKIYNTLTFKCLEKLILYTLT